MKEYKIKINGNPYEVSVDGAETGNATVLVNGTQYNVDIADQNVAAPKPITPRPVVIATPVAAAPKSGGSAMKSPLPGLILEVKLREGDEVKEGQCIMILEAMKMENNIDAHRNGKITRLLKKQGDTVLEGDELFVIE
jgi:biotin carboxyl carrier protein